MIGLIWNQQDIRKFSLLKTLDIQLIQSDLINFELLKDLHLIIIPIEINHQQKKHVDFYGIKILRRIRLEFKLTIPVVLLSFLSESWYIRKSTLPEFQILKTPGHYFYQLPVVWEALLQEELEGIDDNTLHDINNTFFTVEGIVDEEFHDLKNIAFKDVALFQSKELLLEQLLKDVRSSFSKLENSFELIDNSLIVNILDRLENDLEKCVLINEDYDGSIVVINNYIGEVKRLLPPEVKNTQDNVLEPSPPWQVLFIDDDLTIATRIQTLFKEKDIICQIAHCAEEAFEILKTDINNEITVLICDYRMLNKDKSWQKLQGYNILEEVFLNFSNELSFFSLTSFNKRTLIRMQNIHNMKVHSASKDDVIGKSQTVTGFNLFAAKVREEGNKVFDLKRSQPIVRSWTKGYDKKFDRPLQAYYRLHRLAKDVDLANIQIENTADHFFEAIRKSKHQNKLDSNIDILSIQEGIGVDRKREATKEENIEKFRVKLTGRRVAIALYQLLDMDKGQIYSAMKSGRYRQNPPKENDNTINQFFSTFMALSLEKDIPNHLLPEEKNWLKSMEKKYGYGNE